MPDEDDLIDYEKCSYCGTQIPADIVRCPKCGNYTDGAGPGGRAGRRWDAKKVVILLIALAAIAAFLATSFGGC
jgi:hypothetical protein